MFVSLRVCTDIRSAVTAVHVSYKRRVQRATQMQLCISQRTRACWWQQTFLLTECRATVCAVFEQSTVVGTWRRWNVKPSVSSYGSSSELLNEFRLNLIFRFYTKSVHKLRLWLVSVQYSYSESGKRVRSRESSLQPEQHGIMNGTQSRSTASHCNCTPISYKLIVKSCHVTKYKHY